MISYLDEQVGKLVDHLKEKGLYENTIMIFTSDNGPAWNAGTDPEWFGSAGPFRGTQGYGKGSLHEGGIRVPLIVSWPGTTKPGVTDHVSAFQDLLPTLCDITGTEIPENTDGISFMPLLKGKRRQVQHHYLYWEFPEYGGQQAVVTGKYKALRKEMHRGNEIFELYDLENDPGETTDISSGHPDVMRKVQEIILKEHQPSGNPRWRFKLLDN